MTGYSCRNFLLLSTPLRPALLPEAVLVVVSIPPVGIRGPLTQGRSAVDSSTQDQVGKPFQPARRACGLCRHKKAKNELQHQYVLLCRYIRQGALCCSINRKPQ
jgi:hypothetical protein